MCSTGGWHRATCGKKSKRCGRRVRGCARPLPAIEGLLADPEPPCQVAYRHFVLDLLQHVNDLFDRKKTASHDNSLSLPPSSVCRKNNAQNGTRFLMQVNRSASRARVRAVLRRFVGQRPPAMKDWTLFIPPAPLRTCSRYRFADQRLFSPRTSH